MKKVREEKTETDVYGQYTYDDVSRSAVIRAISADRDACTERRPKAGVSKMSVIDRLNSHLVAVSVATAILTTCCLGVFLAPLVSDIVAHRSQNNVKELTVDSWTSGVRVSTYTIAVQKNESDYRYHFATLSGEQAVEVAFTDGEHELKRLSCVKKNSFWVLDAVLSEAELFVSKDMRVIVDGVEADDVRVREHYRDLRARALDAN